MRAVCYSGYVLCDIPSHADAALEIFEDRSPQTPEQPPLGGITAAGATAGAGGSPKSRGGVGEGLDSNSPRTAPDPAAGGAAGAGATGEVAERFRPTHVVYLHASLEHIVERQGQRGTAGAGEAAGAGKEAEAKLRARLERYFAQEQQADPLEAATESTPPDSAPAPPGEKRRPSNSSSNSSSSRRGPGTQAGGHGNGSGDDGDRSEAERRWIPATARSLQDRYAIRVQAINAEDSGGGGGGGGSGREEDASDAVVAAVDEHVCGGEVPGFVWMLSGGDGGADPALEEDAGRTSADKKPREGSGGGGSDGGGVSGESCGPAGNGVDCTQCFRVDEQW